MTQANFTRMLQPVTVSEPGACLWQGQRGRAPGLHRQHSLSEPHKHGWLSATLPDSHMSGDETGAAALKQWLLPTPVIMVHTKGPTLTEAARGR